MPYPIRKRCVRQGTLFRFPLHERPFQTGGHLVTDCAMAEAPSSHADLFAGGHSGIRRRCGRYSRQGGDTVYGRVPRVHRN